MQSGEIFIVTLAEGIDSGPCRGDLARGGHESSQFNSPSKFYPDKSFGFFAFFGYTWVIAFGNFLH